MGRLYASLSLLLLAGIIAMLSGMSTRVKVAAPDEPTATTASRASPADRVTRAPTRVQGTAGGAARFTLARVRPGAGVLLRSRPGGPLVARAGARTRFGSPTVLWVARRSPDGRWLGVVSETLPNGRLGWIRASSPRLAFSHTRYWLRADLSARRLELRRGRSVLARITVTVGGPDSPTPTGYFAITDKRGGRPRGGVYGCCVLALSGRQPKLPAGWRGGNRLAIHGLGAPGPVGAAASAGCMRVAEPPLRRLMRSLPLGTPVFVRA